jgi:hypothetical protein
MGRAGWLGQDVAASVVALVVGMHLEEHARARRTRMPFRLLQYQIFVPFPAWTLHF